MEKGWWETVTNKQVGAGVLGSIDLGVTENRRKKS